MTESINFSTNWNNKLDCYVFTTLRLKNPRKYRINAQYNIELNRKKYKTAEIIGIRTIKLSDINEFVAGLDTGYSKTETLKILDKMYGKKVNLETQPFYFILLKTI